MDIRPIGNSSAQPGQRVSETGNFNADLPSVPARQGAAPVQTVNAVQQTAPIPAQGQLDSVVKQINDTLKTMSQGIEFSIDSDAHRTIVKVVDQETQTVLRQMPTQEALEIAKALDRVQGLLIKQKA